MHFIRFVLHSNTSHSGECVTSSSKNTIIDYIKLRNGHTATASAKQNS